MKMEQGMDEIFTETFDGSFSELVFLERIYAVYALVLLNEAE
jgi:hypothetical protein